MYYSYSRKPTRWEFFVPAQTQIGVTLLMGIGVNPIKLKVSCIQLGYYLVQSRARFLAILRLGLSLFLADRQSFIAADRFIYVRRWKIGHFVY